MMSELSKTISEDVTFKAVYKTFTKQFSQFTYQTSNDATAIFQGELLIGRIFFLKDLSGTVRFIQLIIGRETDRGLFESFFKTDLKKQITEATTDLNERADILLTTFEIHVFDMDDKDLRTSILKISSSDK